MKIEIKKRHNTHNNDCWCDAISMLTKQPYDKVYKMFKPMLFLDGSLSENIVKGYLGTKDYLVLSIKDTKLYEAINTYNTTNGIIFIMRDVDDDNSHTIYMKGNVIYDTEQNTYIEKMLYDYNVINVIMKLENDYE